MDLGMEILPEVGMGGGSPRRPLDGGARGTSVRPLHPVTKQGSDPAIGLVQTRSVVPGLFGAGYFRAPVPPGCQRGSHSGSGVRAVLR